VLGIVIFTGIAFISSLILAFLVFSLEKQDKKEVENITKN
jgi:hypothetical protein